MHHTGNCSRGNAIDNVSCNEVTLETDGGWIGERRKEKFKEIETNIGEKVVV